MSDPTHAAARPGDPSTSHLAAENIKQSRLEAAVYVFMWARRSRYMTVVEIAKEMGIDKWSVSPRMKPLWIKGYLDDPIKVVAVNSAGNIRMLQAWRVKDITR